MSNDFNLSADDVKGIKEEVEAGGQLSTPTVEENPTFTQGAEEGLGRWSEVVKVRETSFKAPKSRPESTTERVFYAKLEVLGSEAGGLDAPNKGRMWTFVQYVNSDDKKDSKKAGFYARKVALGIALPQACGADTSEGINFDTLYNGETPMVGQVLTVSFNKYKYTNKKTGEVKREFEATGFFPTEMPAPTKS